MIFEPVHVTSRANVRPKNSPSSTETIKKPMYRTFAHLIDAYNTKGAVRTFDYPNSQGTPPIVGCPRLPQLNVLHWVAAAVFHCFFGRILDLGSRAEPQKSIFSLKILLKNCFFGRILDLGSRAERQKSIFSLKILLKNCFFGRILDLGSRAKLQKSIFL